MGKSYKGTTLTHETMHRDSKSQMQKKSIQLDWLQSREIELITAYENLSKMFLNTEPEHNGCGKES